ncbi:MAG: PilN domain-containing protein [Selenomonas sp.]|uniref:PilN domain-containing protein n=1 Tax=Selenomonas sp. TaxID=2053611 RepID=UPI0025E38A10|nr:PilN domain-containing protein [Selenomonas sp.]MCR5757667.1 PilN domain-containing protein [Selenomonas sp.]
MYGLAGRLRDYFLCRDREFVAFLPAADPAGACLEKFTLTDGIWQAAERVPVSSASQLLTEQSGEKQEPAMAEIVGQAALILARKGWQSLPLLYVVPADEMLGFALQLPPALSFEQQWEAAYWEFDAKLLARGLRAENFSCLCRPAAGKEGLCSIVGVRRGYLQEVERIFTQGELFLADILPAASQGEDAVLAYLKDSRREKAGFKGRPGKRFSASHILTAWFGIWILLGMMVLAMDLYHYQQAQSLAAEQQQELQGLEAEQRAMKQLVDKHAAIARREELLQELGQQGKPWYSLLVHLGTNTAEGVSVTEIHADEAGEQLKLEGQAVNYDALADFVSQLEADKDFFAGGVKLDKSVLAKGNGGEPDRVRFAVSVKGELGNDGPESEKAADDSF